MVASVELLRPGRLLVANPRLADSNFERTVVMLVAYGEEGALGLILNRPSDMAVSSPLPQWAHIAAEPAVMFLGGPVSHQAVICLARAVPTTGGGPAGGWKELEGDLGTLDLDSDPGAISGQLSAIRLFAGYAGWAAGQLEGEMEAGAWWVLDAEPDDPFTVAPDSLWKRVLLRQAEPLRLVAFYPANPAWN